MTTAGQRALEWYRLLAFPSRVWAIDVLKAFGDMTAEELAEEVPAGARRNMAKVHLPALQKAQLVESYADEHGVTRYRPTLGEPVDLDIDPDDEMLRRALMEFERVYTQRRIDRIRQWASEHWTKWSERWARAATTADYFEQATPEDLERFGDRLAEAIDELRAAGVKRKARGEDTDVEPVFITVSCFPLRRSGEQ